ncbi:MULTISPECIES: helix-turn-helix transcriptional regulator [unclassified Aureispira]|uniref:ArsR/SmtB family transcription factor n=1 Tax=unclassified Aureispira TaxID=2649989 RepID=UPI000696B9E1|nr:MULTISPECIES: helix-turn-helix domain-containing protein [unclassified Aureispira]WMX15877.1 helix-turn-helix domain-containing protein [Aureispira sp. CCB-E]
MDKETVIEISRLLANPTRLEILEWLREPEKNFPPHEVVQHFDDGVCLTYIQKKAGLSQSTISTYLANMKKCGLLTLTRHGKWSYFKRNEATLKAYAAYIL